MAAKDVQELEADALFASPGLLLRMAQLKAYHLYFDSMSDTEMNPGEFSALWMIAKNPGVRQGAVAEKLQIKRAHMTKMIRGFEDRGLISREVPEDNRRSVELTLTGKGATLVTDFEDQFLNHFDGDDNPLTAKETEQLCRLLTKFIG